MFDMVVWMRRMHDEAGISQETVRQGTGIICNAKNVKRTGTVARSYSAVPEIWSKASEYRNLGPLLRRFDRLSMEVGRHRRDRGYIDNLGPC